MNITRPQLKIKLQKEKFRVSKSQIVLLLVILISGIAIVTYSDADDYRVYYEDYFRLMKHDHVILTRNYETAFYLVMYLFAKLHVPFEVFYGIYMSVAICFLGRFINANARHKTFVWILCIFFPFIYYVQQIRSTMATMIILSAIGGLSDSNVKRWKRVIKFVLYCLIACLFQQTSLLYVTLVLALFIEKKWLKRFVILVNLLLPVMLYLFYPQFVTVLRIVTHNHWMIDEYFFPSFTVQKYTLFIIGMYLIFYFVLLYIDKVSIRKQWSDTQTELYYKVSLIICMLATLSYLTVLADRITSMVVPIIYVTIDKYTMVINKRLDKALASSACLVFAIVYLAFWIGPWNPRSFNQFFHEAWRRHPKEHDRIIY